MKVAFYKAKGTLFDALIKIWTCPITELFTGKWKHSYSHCEVIFSDGIWFSSSPRDGGVRYKYIVEAPDTWDILTLDVPLQAELMVRDWCTKQVGKKYDWVGVLLGQLLHMGYIQDPHRWYCSEIVSTILLKVGKFPPGGTNEVTPRELHDRLKN